MQKKFNLFKHNKKAFYSYVKSKSTSSHKSILIKKADGMFTQNKQESAEELSAFLQSVCVKH